MIFGYRDRLAILMYHRVLSTPDPYHVGDVDAFAFDWQLSVIKRYFNVLPLTEAAERLKLGTLPRRAVAITFDDGYADNVEIALPILQRHGLHATFFIATDYLDGGRMWNDTVIEAVARTSAASLDLTSLGLGIHDVAEVAARVRCINTLLGQLKYLPPLEREQKCTSIATHIGKPLPDHLMMTTAQLRALHAAGMEIGAHTLRHPILARVAEDEARREIEGSRDRLRELLGHDISTFAYPNGKPEVDYGRRDVEIVRHAGFKLAVSTARGHANSSMDAHQLARIAPWDKTPVRFALRIFRCYLEAPPALA